MKKEKHLIMKKRLTVIRE